MKSVFENIAGKVLGDKERGHRMFMIWPGIFSCVSGGTITMVLNRIRRDEMIIVEHLTKRYGDFTAVSDLSFQIEDPPP